MITASFATAKEDPPAMDYEYAQCVLIQHTSNSAVVERSEIPNAGKGVFADRDYDQGEIVAMYFGRQVKKGTRIPKEFFWYVFEMSNGQDLLPDKKCAAKYINDSVNLEQCAAEMVDGIFQVVEPFEQVTDAMISDIFKAFCAKNRDPHPDVLWSPHNLDWLEIGGVVLMTAIEEIKRGDELYIFYGWEYWKSTLVKMIKKEVYKAME